MFNIDQTRALQSLTSKRESSHISGQGKPVTDFFSQVTKLTPVQTGSKLVEACQEETKEVTSSNNRQIIR